MEKALFFNARPDASSATGYDRNYNADDISNWLSIVWENGVCKTNVGTDNIPQGLKVVEANGLNVNVNAGYAAIKGKAYKNDAIKSFAITQNGTTANRYDYIVLKYDNNINVRDIKLELRTGTNTKPTVANLNRTGDIYELMLAYITVAPSVTTIAQITDTRGYDDTVLETGEYKYGDLHGVCPWFTAVKGYDGYYDAIIQTHESTVTLSSASTTVITDLSSSLYNEKYSIIKVYTNGLREPKTAYTISVSGGYIVITFTAQKAAGAQITVKLDNFLDGEGMTTALAQYGALLQDVADLKGAGEYNYMCNGVNDNVLISNIVKAFMSANFYHSKKLNIIGNFGFTAMAAGNGDTTNWYKLFDFGTYTDAKPRVILDFTKCSEISVPITSEKYTYIFGGTYIDVVGANIYASNTATDTVIRIFDNSAKRVKAEDCRFWVNGYKNSLIAITGTFVNCYGDVSNVTENSYCFLPQSAGVVKITGGEYYAYTGASSKQSAIVGQSDAEAVSILYGVSAPTAAKSGYYQTHSLLQWTGGGVLRCTDLISALPLVVVSGIAEVRGTITKSKTNVW